MSEIEANGNEYLTPKARIRQERDDLYNRLFNEFGNEASKIDEGADTSAEQLDRYLLAGIRLYSLKSDETKSQDSLEEGKQWLTKFQQALNGTYQQEKATFAIEEAQYYRDEAKEMDEGTKVKYNKYAANWLRTASNCLEKQEQQPLTV